MNTKDIKQGTGVDVVLMIGNLEIPAELNNCKSSKALLTGSWDAGGVKDTTSFEMAYAAGLNV